MFIFQIVIPYQWKKGWRKQIHGLQTSFAFILDSARN